MRNGSGLGLLAAGAILYWVMDIDLLPFVDDDSLGLILMVVGGIALVAGAVAGTVASTQRTGAGGHAGTGAGTGVGLLLVGAVVLWAVDLDAPYVDDRALGVVLLVAGIVTVAAAVLMNAQRSRTHSLVQYRSR